MKFDPYAGINEIKRRQEEMIDIAKQRMQEYQSSQEPMEYEDTFLKDMVNAIISSQKQIETKIDNMALEAAKSGKKSAHIAFWTLIIAVLTLIATVAGVVITQLF